MVSHFLFQLIISEAEIKSNSFLEPLSLNSLLTLLVSELNFHIFLRLTGKSKGKIERQSIINPDWDFTKMGIGGLGTEFNAIFR